MDPLPIKSEFPVGSHPVLLLQEFIDRARVTQFDFEAYEHRMIQGTLRHELTKGGAEEARKAFHMLSPTEELAVRSRVALQYFVGETPFDTVRHVPMIDFAATELTDELIERIGRALFFVQAQPMHVYSSGRSFHGYVAALATYEQWVRFMGMMLLLNKVDQPPVVDVRWVGHKLKAGIATLRLTVNTKRHDALPAYVRRIDPTPVLQPAKDEDYC